MKPAVAYARVSTKKQGDHGLSLNGQMVQIDHYAAEAGYEIVERFEEAHVNVMYFHMSSRSKSTCCRTTDSRSTAHPLSGALRCARVTIGQ